MQGNWENLENSFWWYGGRFPQNLGCERGRPMHPSPNILHPFPQCNREKFKGKMTKKVVRNSENVDIFGGPRTETKFVKWSATRKRLRTAALEASIEMLAQNTESVIILGGDFNGLRESDVVQRTGLKPLNHTPPTKNKHKNKT